MPDFATRIAALGLAPPDWHRFVERTVGRRIPRSTTSRYVNGQRQPNVFAEAVLALVEKHPAVLAEIKEQGR